MNLKGRTLIKNTSVLTSFLKGVKPSNGTFILKLFFKGDQLKVNFPSASEPKKKRSWRQRSWDATGCHSAILSPVSGIHRRSHSLSGMKIQMPNQFPPPRLAG